MWRTISCFLLLVMSSGAVAVTLTFEDIAYGLFGEPVYSESGVTITSGGGELGYGGSEGVVHLDDFGTSFTASIIVTTGSVFSAESVDILAARNETNLNYELADSSDPTASSFISGSIPADNVLVRGYRGDALVAEDRFSMHDVTTYFFGEDFSAIDSLEIVAAVDMDGAIQALGELYPDYDLIYLDCVNTAPCSHFDVDNLTLDLNPGADPEAPVCGKNRWSGKKPWFHW